MHRISLLKLLEDYRPKSSKEIDDKNRMILFIKDNQNCFERELDIGHITASSWLLDKSGEHALLMHHMKLDKWLQLGGHADGEADILAVSIKESQEESGINSIEAVSNKIFDIDIHAIPANSKDKEHFHYDVRFLLQVKSNEKPLMNGESKELRWISKDRESLPTNEESVTRMFDKWCAQQ